MCHVTDVRIAPLGDTAWLVEFGDSLDAAVNARAVAFARHLQRRGVQGVRDVVPAVASVAVHVDLDRAGTDEVRRAIDTALAEPESEEAAPSVLHTIPVCYGGAHGPDLDAVAQHAGLTPAEVIRRHAERTYRVFMLGFLPGFPYLGIVDPVIAMPRHASPRQRVPAGSVGIAGQQTGIYPVASPGGWRILGRTTFALFDPRATPPAHLRPGDTVQFVAVDPAEYELALAAAGSS
jgi:KipI family sensor histidine kinase inhibitor